ncbi:hypothetical protein H0X09_02315 [Candidatus Saccharibacteria bacterium]|nr:hypothetical protein [Candidatus Saccharibacteria bacterium]
MMLIIHIGVALSSILAAGYLYLNPSKNALRLSKFLVAATLVTGTYLIFSLQVNLLRVCAVGLVYLTIVTYLIFLAHRKLALESSFSRK